MRKLAPQVNVLDLENYSEGFVALQSGQGDALTTDNAILLGMIDTNPDYRLAGNNFTDEPYGVAINKGQEDFRDRLEMALETIQGNGVYDEIYDKWFGEILPADSPNTQALQRQVPPITLLTMKEKVGKSMIGLLQQYWPLLLEGF